MAERRPPDPEEFRIMEIGESYLDGLHAGGAIDPEALMASHPDIRDLLERRLALIEMIYRARPRP